MGLRKVIFTMAIIAPGLAMAHSQGLAHSHSHNGHSVNVEQQVQNLPRVDEAGQRTGATSPVYIYNNNRDHLDAASVQSEPTTFVQAAPLSTSRADQMRTARKDMEIKTEEKIVEKLEESRIVDEQRRAERLFGNRMGALHNNNSQWQKAQPQIQQQPVVRQVVPVQVVPEPMVKEKTKQPAFSNTVVINSGKDSEVVEEADGSLTVAQKNSAKASVITTEQDSEENWLGVGTTTYIAPMAGMVDHSDASNVESNGGFGAALGAKYQSGLAIEGSFLYSNHDGSYKYLTTGFGTITNQVGIDQYNIAGAAKYYIGKNRLQPFIGGVISYTRRDYVPQNSSIFGSNSSNAFDGGLTAGADLAVTKDFAVGLDYRFMQNISNEFDTDVTSSNGSPTPQVTSNGTILQQFNTNGENFQNLEDMSYHVLMLTGKLTF